jgi:hypothetical protein
MLCSDLERLFRHRNLAEFERFIIPLERVEYEITSQVIYIVRCGICGEKHSIEASGKPHPCCQLLAKCEWHLVNSGHQYSLGFYWTENDLPQSGRLVA